MSGQTHRSDPRILNRRSLERDHSRLAEILRPGMSVLDAGCGTGAITLGIAQAVIDGRVVGLDRDVDNLKVARGQNGGRKNLTYELGDVLTLEYTGCFDVVNAARTLQWISDPAQALARMKRAAKPGGCVVVLDYNLAGSRWEPDVPDEFAVFYHAFLDWRTANRWDNHMADRLPDLFRAAGLRDIDVHLSDQIAARGEADFAERAGIWTYVTSTIGPHIVAAGLLEEGQPLAAERAYSDWVANGLNRQTLEMRTVTGVRAANHGASELL